MRISFFILSLLLLSSCGRVASIGSRELESFVPYWVVLAIFIFMSILFYWCLSEQIKENVKKPKNYIFNTLMWVLALIFSLFFSGFFLYLCF